MNILETVLSYDTYERTKDIDVSPSEITSKSNYQRWLAKQGVPDTYTVAIKDRVSSVVGTAFHELASKALCANDNFNGYSELPVKGEIAGYKVGGTIDVVYDVDDTYIVGDFKTMGAYSYKLAVRDNFQSYVAQLSIYSYLYSQSLGYEYSELGELYIVVTGDAGYFRKDEGGGKTPKYETMPLMLMSKHEVEELVAEKMLAITEEPDLDCEEWQCNWCSKECEFRIDQSSRKTGNK